VCLSPQSLRLHDLELQVAHHENQVLQKPQWVSNNQEVQKDYTVKSLEDELKLLHLDLLEICF